RRDVFTDRRARVFTQVPHLLASATICEDKPRLFALENILTMFVLDLRNSSGFKGFSVAEKACASKSARLASLDELLHAVVQCFFSECTRGWLHGGTVGKSNLKYQVRLRVNWLSVALSTPCGDPPSFPYARLQEHSGFETGDELLYTCAPGYAMPGGDTSFSLLCDSCGEWYGTVQICVKDQTESHVDYEDKYSDSYGDADHSLESQEEVHGETHQHGGRILERQDSTLPVKVQQKQHREPDIRGKVTFHVVRTETAAATEEPVSVLSQKHMFWFPSEAFQEEGYPVSTDLSSQTTQRTSGIHDDRDSHESDGGHPRDIISVAAEKHQNVTQIGTGGKATKADTWLDSYPVAREKTKNGESKTGTNVVKMADRPNEVEVRKPVPSSQNEHDSTGRGRELDQGGVGKVELGAAGTPAAFPDLLEPSDSPSYSDTLDYDTQQAAPTRSWLDDLTEQPLQDHGPAPSVHNGEAFTGVMGGRTVHNLPGEAGERGELEGDMRGTMCTGENCPPPPPVPSGRGPKVAAIIVAVCAVATAVMVGVWCYRRQQQKSSAYEMNGKGQSQITQSQQIEMQQKV
uniref:Sushi domain containing 5 n=1 Tax=Oryzias latipes TaxID=8090 RepID=A0A3P9MMG3_ORYLA